MTPSGSSGSAFAVVDLVSALEVELQTPECRADEARVRELLADDFIEIGASGREWDLASTLAMLRDEAGDTETGVIGVAELEAREIAPGVVQVFWTSDRGGRRARRSSLWCRRDSRWQLVFHQGTPAPM